MKGLHWSNGLAETVGKFASQDIYQDGVKITKEYEGIKTIKTIKPLSWFKQGNLFYCHS